MRSGTNEAVSNDQVACHTVSNIKRDDLLRQVDTPVLNSTTVTRETTAMTTVEDSLLEDLYTIQGVAERLQAEEARLERIQAKLRTQQAEKAAREAPQAEIAASEAPQAETVAPKQGRAKDQAQQGGAAVRLRSGAGGSHCEKSNEDDEQAVQVAIHTCPRCCIQSNYVCVICVLQAQQELQQTHCDPGGSEEQTHSVEAPKQSTANTPEGDTEGGCREVHEETPTQTLCYMLWPARDANPCRSLATVSSTHTVAQIAEQIADLECIPEGVALVVESGSGVVTLPGDGTLEQYQVAPDSALRGWVQGLHLAMCIISIFCSHGHTPLLGHASRSACQPTAGFAGGPGGVDPPSGGLCGPVYSRSNPQLAGSVLSTPSRGADHAAGGTTYPGCWPGAHHDQGGTSASAYPPRGTPGLRI